MRRYTTPTIELTVEGVDLTGVRVLVTFAQRRQRLTIEDATVAYDGTDTTVTLSLTQEQLGRFAEGEARVQVNWVDMKGHRNATVEAPLVVTGNLLERVISYDG